ncbi:hypothetical protein RRG08_049074 [Elysia crispata]|uniref:Uncharacterized protein n=1 Tax=Elysia crispata TaxID=231223 RepID=A0AAE1A9U8_9GAST|nr:hypothetical protein RRG08_049074 [Elysia crispata]
MSFYACVDLQSPQADLVPTPTRHLGRSREVSSLCRKVSSRVYPLGQPVPDVISENYFAEKRSATMESSVVCGDSAWDELRGRRGRQCMPSVDEGPRYTREPIAQNEAVKNSKISKNIPESFLSIESRCLGVSSLGRSTLSRCSRKSD